MPKRPRPKTTRTDRKPDRRDRQPAGSAPVPSAPVVRLERPPQVPGPAPEAVRIFQKGMEALQRHLYDQAAETFRSLLSGGFPSERPLLDRARVYLELCDRELRKSPPEPKTTEERLTAATAALNNADDARAERLARSVLAEDARHELALYLLASVEARRGAHDAALASLGRAIAVSPEVGAQARTDPDFESLRQLPAFHELTEPPPGSTGPRRARRGRTER